MAKEDRGDVIEQNPLKIEELGKLIGARYGCLKDESGMFVSGNIIDLSKHIYKWAAPNDIISHLLREATWNNKKYRFPEEETIKKFFGRIFPRTLDNALFVLEGVGSGDRERSFFNIYRKNCHSDSCAFYTDISPSVLEKRDGLCDILSDSDLHKIIAYEKEHLKKERGGINRVVTTLLGHTLANFPLDSQKKIFKVNSKELHPGDMFLVGIRTIEFKDNAKDYKRMIEEYNQEPNKRYILGLFENAFSNMKNSQDKIEKLIKKDSEFSVLYDDKKNSILSCIRYPKTSDRYLVINKSQRFREKDIKKANGFLPKFSKLSFFYDSENPTCMVVSCMKESMKEKMGRYAKKGILLALIIAAGYGLNQLHDYAYYKKLNAEYNAYPDKLEFLLKRKPHEIMRVAGKNEIERFIKEDIKERNKNHFIYYPYEGNQRMKVISCALDKNIEEFIRQQCQNKSDYDNYLGILEMQQPKIKNLTHRFSDAYTEAANDAGKVVSRLNLAYYESMRSNYMQAIESRKEAKKILENSKSITQGLKDEFSDKILSENIIDMTYNIETGKEHEELRKQLTEDKINPLLRKSAMTEKETECLALMYFSRGRLNFRDKRYDDAKEDFEQALKFGINLPAIKNDVNHELADLLFEQADYKDSVKLCDQVLSAKIGANTNAWTSFIKLKSLVMLSALGKKQANIEDIIEQNYQQFKEVEINGRGWNRYFNGINYLANNNIKKANEMFNEAYNSLDTAKKESDRAKAMFQIGRCLYLLKDYSGAEEKLAYALSIFENKDETKKDIDKIVWAKEALFCEGYLIKVYEKSGKEKEKNIMLGQFKKELSEFYKSINKGKICNNLVIDTEMGRSELNSIWN